MKSVVLCEKPSVARDIARNLGAKQNKNGCLEGDKYVGFRTFSYITNSR